MTDKQKSRLALWLSGIYFAVGFVSWLLPLFAKPGESLSGIFVVMLTQPWATLLTIVTERLQLDSFVLNMTVMLIGVLVNSWIIYKIVSLVSCRGK
jgi:hypothetical protein